MSFYERRALLVQCGHCGFWNGVVTKRFNPKKTPFGPKTIDTICSICSKRLRRKLRTREKRGAHNRGQSIIRVMPWENVSTAKSRAAKMNRRIQRKKRENPQYNPTLFEIPEFFVPASELKFNRRSNVNGKNVVDVLVKPRSFQNDKK
jgi:hypothetical protein